MLLPVIIFAGKLHADDHPIKSADQQVVAAGTAMLRRYVEGERLTYLMKGLNEDWRYEIQGHSVEAQNSVPQSRPGDASADRPGYGHAHFLR